MNHPYLCFVFIETTKEIGLVMWGESGYYRTDYGTGFSQEYVDYLNEKLEITKEQSEAMKICSMVNPKDWESHYKMIMEMIETR